MFPSECSAGALAVLRTLMARGDAIATLTVGELIEDYATAIAQATGTVATRRRGCALCLGPLPMLPPVGENYFCLLALTAWVAADTSSRRVER